MLRELSTFIFIFSLLVKLISDNFKILSIKLFISNVFELIIFKKFLFSSIEKFSKSIVSKYPTIVDKGVLISCVRSSK